MAQRQISHNSEPMALDAAVEVVQVDQVLTQCAERELSRDVLAGHRSIKSDSDRVKNQDRFGRGNG